MLGEGYTPLSHAKDLVLILPSSPPEINRTLWDAYLPPYLPFLPEAVKVLDIDLTGFWRLEPEDVHTVEKLRGFTNVTTVRRLGAHTVSLVGDFPFGSPGMKCVNYVTAEGQAPNEPYSINLIPGVAVHIFHLQWDPDLETNMDFFFLDHKNEVKDFTLVLWPTHVSSNEHAEYQSSTELWSILRSLEEVMPSGAHLTIVGAEKLRLEHIDNDPEYDAALELMEPHERLHHHLLFALRFVWHSIPDDEKDATMARVRCLTEEEWHSSLSSSDLELFGYPGDDDGW